MVQMLSRHEKAVEHGRGVLLGKQAFGQLDTCAIVTANESQLTQVKWWFPRGVVRRQDFLPQFGVQLPDGENVCSRAVETKTHT